MKQEKLKWTFILSFLIAILIIGCGREELPPTTITPIDSTRVQSVKAAFNNDPLLASENINITVLNDEVTLTGTVHSEEAKQKATDLARKTRGVNIVKNKLEVINE